MGPGGEHEVMRELAALGVHFYPAPMLIRRAQKIGLTPDQLTKLRQEMLSTQAHTVDLVAKLQHAKVEAARLLAADKVDEHAVDGQVEEAAKAQAELHKLHLGTMLRVRALLTPEQRQKLEEHDSKHEGPKPAMSSAGQAPGVTGAADDDDDDDDDNDDVDG
jgi:Spy/CpxP family protein refolding chaperone